MAAEESQKGAAATTIESTDPSAAVGSCGWLKLAAKDGSFMTKFKDRFSGFIHAPMDEHKACFKTTIQKMVGKFSFPKQGENNLAVEAQAALEK